MSTKTLHFNVEVKNIVITSGSYQVTPIGNDTPSPAPDQKTFTGNTFKIETNASLSGYFAVTVLINSYTLKGVAHTVKGKPVNLLATFYLPDIDHPIVVSPESSIASIYTFAQFITIKPNGLVGISGTTRNMKIAYGMKQNLYLTAGKVANMIRQSPNGFETNSYPMFNSLCNLFYYCLTDTKVSSGKTFYQQFLDLVWHKKTQPNESFLGALRNLTYDPFTNAHHIYQLLVNRREIYKDSLLSMRVPDEEKAPDQWTLTLKANTSGARNFIPSGLAFVVFDADDNGWVANNFRAGSNISGTHCPVYKYNATPASFSPVQGGGLLGVAFGAAIDPEKKHISFGNFGWGPELNNPQQGSISRFYYQDGKPLSPPNGYTYGLSRVQGLNYDKLGNLWMASVGCQDPFAPAPTGAYPFKSEPSAVVVYLNGEATPENTLICNKFPVKRTAKSKPVRMSTPYLKIFDVVPDNKGNAYVSCIGNYDSKDPDQCALSAVYKVTLQGNKLVVKNSWFSDYYSDINKQYGFESLRQLAINSAGDVVVVGVSSSRATVLSSNLSRVKGYYAVNTYAPWGIKIDQQKTVFLANFGHEDERANELTLDMKGHFGVTMLRDPANPESAKLLTVPTGGSEVMLANGHPLYGTQTRPIIRNGKPTGDAVRMRCHQPIMRLTSTNIDGAGNLWCMNNWKPAAAVDVADNPGGDGVVIFLGIAAPE